MPLVDLSPADASEALKRAAAEDDNQLRGALQRWLP